MDINVNKGLSGGANNTGNSVAKNVTSGEANREDKSKKLKYHLIPHEMITRLAEHYTKGAIPHGDRNRENGDEKFREACKESAWRHFIQWQRGDNDEDHAMSVVWNIFAYERLKGKQKEMQFHDILKAIVNSQGSGMFC